MKLLKVLALAAMVYAPASMATLFELNVGAGNFGNGGSYDSIFTQYNDASGDLTWEVDNAVKNGSIMDGFWVVLNDGPDNPKGTDGLAIFYADFTQDTLWAYAYTGANNALSYTQGPLLESFNGLTNSGTTRGFSVNVSNVYSQIGSEHPYSEEVGIWFHPTWGTNTSTDRDGALTAWGFATQSWYDRAGQDTTVTVPEPAPLALLALGLVAFFFRKQKA